MIDTEVLKFSLVFLCIGGASTFLAVTNWRGEKHARSSYLLLDRPFRKRAVEFQIYGSIPASIMFLLLGVALWLASVGFDLFGKFLFWMSLLAGAFTLFLLIWQPDWIKPAWMKSFERKNQDILDIFFKETHGEFEWHYKQGDKTWITDILTDRGMDGWANEIRWRYSRFKAASDSGELIGQQKQTVSDPLGILIERHPELDINVLVQALGKVLEEDEKARAVYRTARLVDETPYVYHLHRDEELEQRGVMRKPHIVITEEDWLEEIVKQTEEKLRNAG